MSGHCQAKSPKNYKNFSWKLRSSLAAEIKPGSSELLHRFVVFPDGWSCRHPTCPPSPETSLRWSSMNCCRAALLKSRSSTSGSNAVLPRSSSSFFWLLLMRPIPNKETGHGVPWIAVELLFSISAPAHLVPMRSCRAPPLFFCGCFWCDPFPTRKQDMPIHFAVYLSLRCDRLEFYVALPN